MPEPAMLDYFYGDEAEQYTFYRIPKVLFTDPAYRRISSDAMEYLFTSVSISAHVQLQWKNVLALFLLGGCLIFCVVTFSDLPVLRASVRDTLSRMEE